MPEKQSIDERRQAKLRDDFQKTFETEHGERVLMWLYASLYGKQTTMPADGNAMMLAKNEGMRMAWLLIAENLRHEDMDIRKMFEERIEEVRKEKLAS